MQELTRVVGRLISRLDDDVDVALIGDALFGPPGVPNPFRPLLDLYATGYAIDATDDDGVEMLVLLAPPCAPS